jgi:hypothetical protein
MGESLLGFLFLKIFLQELVLLTLNMLLLVAAVEGVETPVPVAEQQVEVAAEEAVFFITLLVLFLDLTQSPSAQGELVLVTTMEQMGRTLCLALSPPLVVASAVAETVPLHLYQTVVPVVLAVVAVANSIRPRFPREVLEHQARVSRAVLVMVLALDAVAVAVAPEALDFAAALMDPVAMVGPQT